MYAPEVILPCQPPSYLFTPPRLHPSNKTENASPFPSLIHIHKSIASRRNHLTPNEYGVTKVNTGSSRCKKTHLIFYNDRTYITFPKPAGCVEKQGEEFAFINNY